MAAAPYVDYLDRTVVRQRIGDIRDVTLVGLTALLGEAPVGVAAATTTGDVSVAAAAAIAGDTVTVRVKDTNGSVSVAVYGAGAAGVRRTFNYTWWFEQPDY